MKGIKKGNELDTILHLISLGFTKREIRDRRHMSKSALSNHLAKLEEMKCIERQGKFIIKYLRSSPINPGVTNKVSKKEMNKRGHAFNFKIYFPQEKTNLKEKIEVRKDLKNKRLKVLPFGSYQLIKNKNTIWINNHNLTIYCNKSYYSADALKSKFGALRDVDILVKNLRDKYNFKGSYGIEVFREHYGIIFNKFAKWLLDKGLKLTIKDEGDKSILWVDDSRKDDLGLKEFEGSNPIEVNQASDFFESCERTGWKVTPEFTLEAINKIIKVQLDDKKQLGEFAFALNKHIPAYEKLGDFTEMLYNNQKKQNELLLGAIADLRKEINSLKPNH